MIWKKLKDTENELNYYKKVKNKTYNLKLVFMPSVDTIWAVEYYVWESMLSTGMERTIYRRKERFKDRKKALVFLKKLKRLKI